MRTQDLTKYIAVNGAKLGYRMYGSGSSQPPILFLHGGFLRSSSGLYDELLELLAERYTVYALDLRGHGASADAWPGWSLEALADDIPAFSHALELDSPVLIGHSLGAFTSLYAAIRHPGMFTALCLLSPGPANPTLDPVNALDFLIEHGHDRHVLNEGISRMFVRPPGRMLDVMLDAITLIDKEVFRALKRQNAQISIDDRLKEVSAPVLIICGERDNVVPASKQHDIARKVQCSKEVIFSTEGHMLPNERPALVAREILAFLDHDRISISVA